MSELERLVDLARDLPPAELAEVIDLAARLRAKRADVPDPDLAEHDRVWLDADASGLVDLEPYDWGPAGPPAGTPVQWDAARGEFVLREAT